MNVNHEKLREEFAKLLTEDSLTSNRASKDYNVAEFFPDNGRLTREIDLLDILGKFDKAVLNLLEKPLTRSARPLGQRFSPPNNGGYSAVVPDDFVKGDPPKGRGAASTHLGYE